MNIPMLDLVGQYKAIKKEIDQAITDVLESGAYIMGPQVRQFEEHIEEFLQVEHAIGVASGSDALVLSLHALGIGPGDKVIVPTFTFFATASAVSRMDATPVFVDIDPENYNLDLDQVENILKTQQDIKAIIPVHLFGLPVDMQRLMDLAEDYHVYIIEDACQAIGAELSLTSDEVSSFTAKAGAIGNSGCFSFFPSKNLGGFGDGGMVVTNDDHLAEKIRMLRVHGSKPKYYHSIIGYNSRLDAIQAAILDVKLHYLNEWNQKRRQVAAVYNETFQAAALQNRLKWPQVVPGHIFHQYVIEIDGRDELAEHLKANGIANAVYYPLPLHLQECFADLNYKEGDLPRAEQACKRVLALPIDPGLTEEQIKYIAKTVIEFIQR